ncbi:DUF899 family protein [Adhaeretor mobilis]|uniref:DUF899 domain-containing protein n=1 Tax=Adhaeretor mobilis TaxID=1930276 RepID=A0A517MT24_9BACT|nr:DUF899 family protein [Adhaeretor mobilis]QDS98036.1 hypothetical protein HG15A2_13060 [Adhaeretor mobilis]
MSDLRFPNETQEYRDARDALLEEEKSLIEKVKAVAAKRRELPRGGKLKEDYVFEGADDDKLGQEVKFSQLFGNKSTLLLYSYMFGKNWDNPCPSCTSLIDGFDRATISVSQDAALVVVAKAPAQQINDWAKQRGWSNIELISSESNSYLVDYKCQSGETDDTLQPVMHVFTKQDDGIYHFWGTELSHNHMDTVWPYWNLMDMTPEGRPDVITAPQNFRSEFLELHYLS